MFSNVSVLRNFSREIYHPKPHKIRVERVDLIVLDYFGQVSREPKIDDLIASDIDLARIAAESFASSSSRGVIPPRFENLVTRSM